MLKRAEPILKLLCLLLGGLAIYFAARIVRPKDSLANLKVPVLQIAEAGPRSAPTSKPTNAPPGHPGRPGRMAGGVEVPPAIQERVDRITQSEILGPVIRPLPMALLGIGGKDAIIRGPTGQTSLLREGEEAGGIKVLKIGTNRVLIEHEGKKKELMIFSGFGSQTLVEKENAK